MPQGTSHAAPVTRNGHEACSISVQKGKPLCTKTVAKGGMQRSMPTRDKPATAPITLRRPVGCGVEKHRGIGGLGGMAAAADCWNTDRSALEPLGSEHELHPCRSHGGGGTGE